MCALWDQLVGVLSANSNEALTRAFECVDLGKDDLYVPGARPLHLRVFEKGI